MDAESVKAIPAILPLPDGLRLPNLKGIIPTPTNQCQEQRPTEPAACILRPPLLPKIFGQEERRIEERKLQNVAKAIEEASRMNSTAGKEAEKCDAADLLLAAELVQLLENAERVDQPQSSLPTMSQRNEKESNDATATATVTAKGTEDRDGNHTSCSRELNSRTRDESAQTSQQIQEDGDVSLMHPTNCGWLQALLSRLVAKIDRLESSVDQMRTSMAVALESRRQPVPSRDLRLHANTETETETPQTVMAGFTTGNMRSISIQAEKLKRASALLDDEGSLPCSNLQALKRNRCEQPKDQDAEFEELLLKRKKQVSDKLCSSSIPLAKAAENKDASLVTQGIPNRIVDQQLKCHTKIQNHVAQHITAGTEPNSHDQCPELSRDQHCGSNDATTQRRMAKGNECKMRNCFHTTQAVDEGYTGLRNHNGNAYRNGNGIGRDGEKQLEDAKANENIKQMNANHTSGKSTKGLNADGTEAHSQHHELSHKLRYLNEDKDKDKHLNAVTAVRNISNPSEKAKPEVVLVLDTSAAFSLLDVYQRCQAVPPQKLSLREMWHKSLQRKPSTNSWIQKEDPSTKPPVRELVRDMMYLEAGRLTFPCYCPRDLSTNAICTLCANSREIGSGSLASFFRANQNPELNFSKYAQVVWKLAAYERQFHKQFLTLPNVLFQYGKKQRRGREFTRCSFLHRALISKTVSLSAHCVLLVSQLNESKQQHWQIELCDGYCSILSETIEACPPAHSNQALLLALIRGKKLYPGLKVHCVNLRLAQGYNGKLFSQPRLVVSYNGLSRALATSSLGLQKKEWLYKCLSSCAGGSGQLAMVDVIVLEKVLCHAESKGACKLNVVDSLEFVSVASSISRKNGTQSRGRVKARRATVLCAAGTEAARKTVAGKRYKLFDVAVLSGDETAPLHLYASPSTHVLEVALTSEDQLRCRTYVCKLLGTL